MKSLLEYKNLIMSTGLIPTIVCMILCIFFSDAYVLYACSLAGLLYVLYRLAKPPIYRPNLVLLHATLALVVCSVIKLISGDSLIPDRTVPIILEIIILSFSLFYLIEPIVYNKIFSFFNYKISILNCWSTRIIAIFSGIHLFILCIIYLLFNPLSYPVLYILTHILPPLIYIISIAVNYILVKSIGTSYQRMPFLRIAPICNGKIYVLPRNTHSEEPGKLDIPMEDYIYTCKTDTDKYAKEIEKKYLASYKEGKEKGFTPVFLVLDDVLLEKFELDMEDENTDNIMDIVKSNLEKYKDINAVEFLKNFQEENTEDVKENIEDYFTKKNYKYDNREKYNLEPRKRNRIRCGRKSKSILFPAGTKRTVCTPSHPLRCIGHYTG